MATGIIGTGSFLPPTIIDNNELAKLVKTNDEWIREAPPKPPRTRRRYGYKIAVCFCGFASCFCGNVGV